MAKDRVERVEIFGYIKIGLRDEPFEFKGTISNAGALTPHPTPNSASSTPAVTPGPTPAAIASPEELPRASTGKLCVSCNERQGSKRLVKGVRSERAVPRVLCAECVTDMFKAGKIIAIENV